MLAREPGCRDWSNWSYDTELKSPTGHLNPISDPVPSISQREPVSKLCVSVQLAGIHSICPTCTEQAHFEELCLVVCRSLT